MNEHPLLSIVIPCYNDSENLIKTLKKIELVIDSSIEIVIVDDCSPDGSYENLVLYKQTNKIENLLVLKNKENVGPGEARNVGIEYAAGSYITFLDSDDWLSSDYFEIIKPILRNNDYDCIIHDAIITGSDGRKYKWRPFFSNISSNELNKKNILVFSKGSVCAKIYKTSIIKKNNVKFLKLKRNEDFPFTKIAISFCEKFLYLEKKLYFYWQNVNSLMHNKSLVDVNNSYLAFDAIASKISRKYSKELEGIFIINFYRISLFYLDTLEKSEWVNKIKSLEENYNNYLNSKYFKKYTWHIKLVVYFSHRKFYSLLKLFNYIIKFARFVVYRIK